MTGRQIGQVNQQSKGETPLVSGILQRAAVSSVANQEVEAGTLRESRFQHDFSQLPIHTGGLPIQAKLKMGAVGDRYEQEADRVAQEVVSRINAPASTQSNQGQSLQRQEEPDEELQAKPNISELQRSPLSPEVQLEAMPEEEEELQAKSTLQRQEAMAAPKPPANAGGETSTDLESAIHSARASGQHLDAGLQRSMGQAFGADFSGVKVHTDAQSDQLNRSIQAKAFTTGQDVFFRQGAYAPGSRGGQELIAHELTHVVQQNGGVVQRKLIDDDSLPNRLAHFGSKYFTRTPYNTQFGDADQEIQDFRARGELKLQKLKQKQRAVTPNPIYTFDLNKELPLGARGFYGYSNPAKDSVAGLEILSKGINLLTPPHTSIDKQDASWHRTKARYASQRPGSPYTDFGYNDAILGHDEGHGIQGASDHFNQIGHTQVKAMNIAWNQDPNNYWGPEHTNESAASGAASPAYRVPLEESGSNPSWL